MGFLIIILGIVVIVSAFVNNWLTNELTNAHEKINILEFEKRQAYIRGVREGYEKGKSYSKEVQWHAEE